MQHGREALFATLDPTLQRLKTALKLLEYDPPVFYMCTREAYHATLHEAVKELNLEVLFDDGTMQKYLRKEDAKKFVIESVKKSSLQIIQINLKTFQNPSKF